MNPQLHTSRATLFEARVVAGTGHLYAVLDACDTPAVPEKAIGLGAHRAKSLYAGTPQMPYDDVAPYLTAVDTEVLHWILGTLWDEPFGIFVHSDESFANVYAHLQKFVMVRSPTGDDWYFRYYDPRVLGKFLPTCDREQLREFFGPIEAFGTSDSETGGVVWVRQSDRGGSLEASAG